MDEREAWHAAARDEEPDAGYADEAERDRERETWDAARAEARRLFDALPSFRIQFERDGTVSLREKQLGPLLRPLPSAAIIWRLVSQHPTLEEAERRLRHVTTPPVYYDARGRLTQAPPADASGPAGES